MPLGAERVDEELDRRRRVVVAQDRKDSRMFHGLLLSLDLSRAYKGVAVPSWTELTLAA
jgi:hypothetical protein